MENVNLKVAQKLKTLRQEKTWSLDLTSQKTGVSKAMLGQIERGESSPTIATLWKIATGFEVSFSSFVEEPISSSENLVYRKQQLQHLHQDDSLIKVMPIFPFDKKMGFEVFIIELLPGCLHLSPPHQKGVVEHIMPVQGTIDIEVNGFWHQVSSSQGFRFAADTPHAYKNASSSPAVFHDIIYYGSK